MTSYLRWNPVSCLRAAAAALFVLLFSSLNVFAQTGAKKDFAIEAGDAASTLKQFAQQSGAELLYSADVVEGVRTHAVKGEFTPKDALEIMVADTALVVSQGRTTGGLAIRRATEAEAKNVNRAIAESSKSGRPEQRVKTEKIGGEEVVKMPDYMVKGSKVLNADIPRSGDDVQPYIVISGRDIARSGTSNLEDFLRTRLSMNASTSTLDQAASEPTAVVSGELNLRGLGSSQTLILVDGRRLPSAAPGTTGTFGQPLLNGIPVASIDRIEILASSAGAIYGGGAVGGVINIIRKRQYSGVESAVTYSNTFSSDTAGVQFDLAVGHSFAGGKGNLSGSLAHSFANSLLTTDRDFAIRARQQILAGSPSTVTLAQRPPLGSLPNIARARPRLNSGIFEDGLLVLDNGTVLSAPITHISPGYQGPVADDGASLAANAGSYNLSIPSGEYLLRTPTRTAYTFDIKYYPSDTLQIYASSSGDQTSSDLSQPMQTTNQFFSADDSLNPFQQPVIASIPTPGLRSPARAKAENIQVVGGFLLRFRNNWSASFEHNWGRSRVAINFRTGAILNLAGRSALRDSAFKGIGINLGDLAEFTDTSFDSSIGPMSVVSTTTSIRASGEGFGEVALNLLLERHKERAEASKYQEPSFGLYFPKRMQLTDTAYIEGQVPMFRKIMKNRLNAQFSIRRDSVKTDGAPSSILTLEQDEQLPKIERSRNRFENDSFLIGLRYVLWRYISFRGSYSTGFLPPGINQLTPSYGTENFTSLNIVDPRRGNHPVEAPYDTIRAGNPDIRPERSISRSAGFSFEHGGRSAIRFSVDFLQIRKAGEVFAPGLQFIINNEERFPERVTRSVRLPDDPQEWAGPITKIDSSYINFLATKTNALDIQMELRKDLGQFGMLTVGGNATKTLKLERELTEESGYVEYLDHSKGPLKWKGSANIGWEYGCWAIGWNTQYYKSHFIYTADASPIVVASQTALQGSDRIPAQIYHDAYITWTSNERSRGILRGTSVSLSVQNILDASPPIVVSTASLSSSGRGYSTYGDPRRMRYSILVRKSFGN